MYLKRSWAVKNQNQNQNEKEIEKNTKNPVCSKLLFLLLLALENKEKKKNCKSYKNPFIFLSLWAQKLQQNNHKNGQSNKVA